MRLYSTVSDGGFYLYRFIGCRWRFAAETTAFLDFLLQKNYTACPSKIVVT
ncbi:MAG: hypothetical protein LBP59_14770 [Planctomycetaceae bacterium]|nr:hypothetical protein [Planctomycetaceae bacterium]